MKVGVDMGVRSKSIGRKDAGLWVKGLNLTAFFVKVAAVYGIFDGTFSRNTVISSAFTCS